MKGRYWVGACLMACAFAAFAGSDPAAARTPVEASMLLTGTINIGADGRVAGHSLDHREKLESGVIDLIDRTLPTWRFEPVVEDGGAHKATAKMSLFIVANKLDESHFAVRIRSAHFADANKVASDSVSKKTMTPPRYPVEAYVSGVSGTVYLVLRVDHQGRVADAVVEQVNLRAIASDRQMQHWRELLAGSTLQAAKRWRFNPPSTGKQVGDAFWSVRVPASYRLADEGSPKYGHWQPYVPGPKQIVPWLNNASHGSASNPDALAAGGVYQLGEGLRLLTPLGDG